MKETNWNECLENSKTREITPDIPRAQALKETAEERIENIRDINEKNCNFVFEDYHTSVLELVQARAFEEGYNILNHVCVGFYIRDKLEKEEIYKLFDDVRYKRNSLAYYGKRMEFAVAKEAIEQCKKIIREINRL